VFRLSGLYAITDDILLPNTSKLLEYVRAAINGGAGIIQYRAKHLTKEQKQQQAKQLFRLCHNLGADLLINDDVELAQYLNCGVHLGQEDFAVSEARKLLGGKAIIGATCHNSLELAAKAHQAGASYLAFGRFFPSNTKKAAKPAQMQILQQAKQFKLPICAIGGINLDNAPLIIEYKPNMIAVVHGLFALDSADLVQNRAQLFSSFFRDVVVNDD